MEINIDSVHINELQSAVSIAQSAIVSVEQNIEKLVLLKENCINYRIIWENDRMKSLERIKYDWNSINYQDKLIYMYDNYIEDVVKGNNFRKALQRMEDAESEIDRELMHQRERLWGLQNEIRNLNARIESLYK
ncbi:MAG: hypothetical protein J6C06_08790 [Lachnospiraceae bacterium]|nr:hypothetical protein [Lachnospiraceae bacterium]